MLHRMPVVLDRPFDEVGDKKVPIGMPVRKQTIRPFGSISSRLLFLGRALARALKPRQNFRQLFHLPLSPDSTFDFNPTRHVPPNGLRAFTKTRLHADGTSCHLCTHNFPEALRPY